MSDVTGLMYFCRELTISNGERCIAIGNSDKGMVVIMLKHLKGDDIPLTILGPGVYIDKISKRMPARSHVRKVLSRYTVMGMAHNGPVFIRENGRVLYAIRPFTMPPATKLYPGDIVSVGGRSLPLVYLGQYKGQIYLGSWSEVNDMALASSMVAYGTEPYANSHLYIYLFGGDESEISYISPREGNDHDDEEARAVQRRLVARPAIGSVVGIRGFKGYKLLVSGFSQTEYGNVEMYVAGLLSPDELPGAKTLRKAMDTSFWTLVSLPVERVYNIRPATPKTKADVMRLGALRYVE